MELRCKDQTKRESMRNLSQRVGGALAKLTNVYLEQLCIYFTPRQLDEHTHRRCSVPATSYAGREKSRSLAP